MVPAPIERITRITDVSDGCVTRGGKRVHDPPPDTSPLPTDETIITGGIRREAFGQIAPDCARA
jgi:hypothetical protein